MNRDKDHFFRENPSVLAFLGDAVYEVYVRKHIYEKGILSPDRMNTAAIRYVRAEAQAAVYDALLSELNEKEQSVVRRAKNHKITSMPGNIDFMTYKKATAFEALIGYLDLIGDQERLEEILIRSTEIIDSAKIKPERKEHHSKKRPANKPEKGENK